MTGPPIISGIRILLCRSKLQIEVYYGRVAVCYYVIYVVSTIDLPVVSEVAGGKIGVK